MNTHALLAWATRSERVESEHWGELVVCDSNGRVVQAWGDPHRLTYMRSAAKPFQAATTLLHQTDQRQGWTIDDLAIVCASHAGEANQRAQVESVLSKAGLTPADLQCGPHWPFSKNVRQQLARAGQKPDVLHSNCSGKHAGMMACCRVAGWPVATYRDPAHPLQQENVAVFSRFAGISPTAVEVGIDGCGVPSFYTTPAAMATAFARLTNPDSLGADDRAVARQIVAAMLERPIMLAGPAEFNTKLIEFGQGRVVAKSGAEGVFCLGLPGTGMGVALKVIDGANRAHAAIFSHLLKLLVPELPWPEFLAQTNPPLKNTRGEIVGTIEAAFAI